MGIAVPILILLLAGLIAAYHRLPLWSYVLLGAAALAIGAWLGANLTASSVVGAVFAVLTIALLIPAIRLPLITRPLLDFYTKILPPLTDTERTALEAGTVGFEGELFSGKPQWKLLLDQPKPVLSAEEQAFLDGPCEQLCALADEWQTVHVHADLSPPVWEFIKQHKFFGMIIPKPYGGLGFSAFAHHRVIQKLSSISSTLSATVGVPNSLGPGELLMHYGTPEQKDYYLPRLADGREIPCFGLTGPFAGSDATSIPDFGIVCTHEWNGARVVGIRLSFDKRYITLAPVATLIGLAFRLYDPDGLLGEKKDIGISLALIPRDTPGVEIGRRHFPLNAAFMNGPIRGRDVFVPLSALIGGEEYAGKGWQMLVEVLSIGRSITLPSSGSGSAKMAAVVTGAYARIRKQFGLSIGRFEGVEEALARIAGKAYAISALAQATAAAVARGENPAVPSTIAKYHCTTTGREVVQDAMDVHGGKGIILGPRNYLGRNWQHAPISITVEGANIMTRSLMIFGQGAILCHPWVLKEMQAAALEDPRQRLREFDRNLRGHVGYAISNAVRAWWFGLTAARIGSAPGDACTRRYFRKLDRYCAALALMTDTAMLLLGGKLKFREKLSARLGDVLSELYIASSMLKRHHDEGAPVSDRPLLAWAFHDAVHRIERAFSGALRNFPIRPVGWLLWLLVFPWGRRAQEPSDRLGHRAAALLMAPGDARDRLAAGLYLTPAANNPAGRIDSYLSKVILAEPVERKFVKALKGAGLDTLDYAAQLDAGVQAGWITAEEHKQLEELRTMTLDAITVDDFDPAELAAAATQSTKAPLPSGEGLG
ncbi:MAG: acyl-CoA dehydrogenase [Proteobacteria bacterium]|nr:acyl-CoA dehydrogenase [Pseudomonadota bacterium]